MADADAEQETAAQMFAMPVATGMRLVAARRTAACDSASRPRASGIQMAP